MRTIDKSVVEQMVFDYGALDRDLAMAVKAAAERISIHMNGMMEHAVAVGCDLLAVKEMLPHGAFDAWIESEFPLSKTTAVRWMKAARYVEGKKTPGVYLDGTGLKLIEELLSSATPLEVREEIEKMIEAGEVVTLATVAALKREKEAAEATASGAQETIETLAARNAELVIAAQAPAAPADLDLDAIRAEGAREAEARLNARIKELSDLNVEANAAAKELRQQIEKLTPPVQEVIPPDRTNVVSPVFGADRVPDPDVDDEFDEEGSINAFSGALGSMYELEFGIAEFWKQQGKKDTHGKLVYKAMLEVNSRLALLIKEYAK